MGQTILSAGLIIIVTIAVINANRLVINSESSKMEGLARMQAADVAMELLTEIRMRKFDEYIDTTRYQAVSEFRGVYSLGPDAGEEFTLPDSNPYESLSEYDDIDDFNNYERTANTSDISGYEIRCSVYYATQTYPDTRSSSKTYVKTIEVYVSHPLYLPTPIRMSMTKTY